MNNDMYYTEVQRQLEIEHARKLQTKELSKRQCCEASWCCVVILFLTLVVGFFS